MQLVSIHTLLFVLLFCCRTDQIFVLHRYHRPQASWLLISMRLKIYGYFSSSFFINYGFNPPFFISSLQTILLFEALSKKNFTRYERRKLAC